MEIARTAHRLWQQAGQPQGRYREFWRKVESALNHARYEQEIEKTLAKDLASVDLAVLAAHSPRPKHVSPDQSDPQTLCDFKSSTNLVKPTNAGVVGWGQPGHRLKEGEENASRSKKRSTGDAKFASGVLEAGCGVERMGLP